VSSVNRIAWMWEEALQALERAERRHRQFAGLTAVRAAHPVWEPPADVFESDSEVLVVIALAGVTADAVSVEVAAAGLIVRAERAPRPDFACMRVRRLEIPYGGFERRIELASGQYVLKERRMVDGCLELRLSKE
jgi:HSP20 family protein